MAAQDSNIYTPQDLQKLYSFFKNFEKITSNPSISHTETLPNGIQVRITNREALGLLRKHPDLRSFTDDSKLLNLLKSHRSGRSNPALFNLYQAANSSIYNSPAATTEIEEKSPEANLAKGGSDEPKKGREEKKKPLTQEQTLSPKDAAQVFAGQQGEPPKEVSKDSTSQQALQTPTIQPITTTSYKTPAIKQAAISPTPTIPIVPVLVDKVPEYNPQPQQQAKTEPLLIQRIRSLKMPKSQAFQDQATKVGIVIKRVVSKVPVPVTVGLILGTGAGFISGGLPGAVIGATLGGVGGQYLASKMAGEDRIGYSNNKKGGLSDKARTLADYGTRSYRNKLAKKLASKLGKRLAIATGRSVFTNPWVLGGAIIILLIFIGLPLFDNLFTKPNALLPASRTGGFCGITDINQCLFYGEKAVGLQIGNSSLAGYITETANKVGIPSSILAGIARQETAGDATTGFVAKDPTYFNNDYDSHPSYTNCCFGFMQFYPDTFKNTYNANLLDMTSLFNKTGGVKTDIVSQAQYNDPNDPNYNGKTVTILRIYSVRDSIIDAAFKIRGDKIAYNGPGPWDESAVRYVASAYNAGKPDPNCQTDYCNDLWLSYSRCQTSAGGGSCPIANGKVITGTYAYPENNTGHCGLNYQYSDRSWCTNPNSIDDAHYALDVQTPGGGVDTAVILPTIGSSSVQWKLVKFDLEDTKNPGIGGGLDYQGTDSAGNQYYIHFFHLDTTDPKFNEMKSNTNYLSSGTIVANKLYNMSSPHLHFTISIYNGISANYSMLEPDHDLHMCSSGI